MNKAGEINLENQIKIMDAFDFTEQFTAFTISNIKEGLWLAFDEEYDNEDDEIEEDCENSPNFYLIEKSYFDKSNEMESYDWQRNEEKILIEKGAIGFYNDSLEVDSVKNYYADLENALSSVYQDGIKNQYIVFYTPYGNDGCFAFDTVEENGKIVAIRVDLKEIS